MRKAQNELRAKLFFCREKRPSLRVPVPNLNRISNVFRLKGLSQAAPILKAVSFKIYAALQNPTGLKSIYERAAENLLTDQMFYRERSSQGIFARLRGQKSAEANFFQIKACFLRARKSKIRRSRFFHIKACQHSAQIPARILFLHGVSCLRRLLLFLFCRTLRLGAVLLCGRTAHPESFA